MADLRNAPQDDRELARAIARSLGIPAVSAEPLPGGGQNHVVRVRSREDDVVVRWARDPEDDEDPFDAEAWVLRSAEEIGLPTSSPIARGVMDGVSYLVVSYVPGVPASADDLQGWRAIGRFAAGLRAVSTHDAPDSLFPRFGRDLDAAWSEHLAYNSSALQDTDPLIGLGVYPRASRGRLQDLLAELSSWDLGQGLVHGDLSHRNLLRGEMGYHVLDWGTVAVGPTGWSDLERLLTWNLLEDAGSPVTRDAWDAVLDGAGVDHHEALPIVRSLAAVHALDLVRWAIDCRPDRLDGIILQSREIVRGTVLEPRGIL